MAVIMKMMTLDEAKKLKTKLVSQIDCINNSQKKIMNQMRQLNWEHEQLDIEAFKLSEGVAKLNIIIRELERREQNGEN